MAGAVDATGNSGGPAQLVINGSQLGTALLDILMAPDIVPGADPSYELCKQIYLYHPLGSKMAETPITMAQSQQRTITIPRSPEERVKKAFIDQWTADGVDAHIHNLMKTSRIYGIASIALLTKDTESREAVDFRKLWEAKISFNILDPLNTAGSLVLNQDPNAMDFQKFTEIAIGSIPYHRSRTVTILNEKPIYIKYTPSAFGFVGRSVYQRALFPLKSFIQTMVTDDMVARKAGLIVAKIKPAGSIIDNAMQFITGIKRAILNQGVTNNVISVGNDDEITAIDLTNTNTAMQESRKDIIENVASAADMPAMILKHETYAEGFGEGTEDAKNVARYIDRVRTEMQTVYDYFDKIIQYRAWNPEFYRTIQKDFPEDYGSMAYETAFYQWRNSFAAVWPNLLTEPDSEKVATDETRFRTILGIVEVLAPMLDPENKAALVEWVADNLNDNKFMFQTPLELDYDALREYTPQQQGGEEGEQKEPKPPRPFADSWLHPSPNKGVMQLTRRTRDDRSATKGA